MLTCLTYDIVSLFCRSLTNTTAKCWKTRATTAEMFNPTQNATKLGRGASQRIRIRDGIIVKFPSVVKVIAVCVCYHLHILIRTSQSFSKLTAKQLRCLVLKSSNISCVCNNVKMPNLMSNLLSYRKCCHVKCRCVLTL